MKLDVEKVSAAALRSAKTLVREWLPDGHRRGNEWIAKNPTRADRHEGSFSVNLEKGAWADFATGDRGSDLISLKAYVVKSSQSEAAREIEQRLGLGASSHARRTLRADKPATGWRPLTPIPADAPTPHFTHRDHGAPSGVWTYRDQTGATLFLVARFDKVDNSKVILPLSYCRHQGTGQAAWRWKGLPASRPIYNLDVLAAKPNARVVVVEGEKAADSAAQLLPDHVVTTSANGSANGRYADWAPLNGRDVVIWPDNDEAGQAYAETAAELLSAKVGSVKIAQPPVDARLGWDAADAVADDWDHAAALRLIENATDWQPMDAPPHGRKPRAMSRKPGRGRKQEAVRLVELTTASGIELWRSPLGEPWATVTVEGHKENYSLRDERFDQWLRHLVYQTDRQVPSGQAFDSVKRTLGAIAQTSPVHEIKVRVAQRGGIVYVDLGDEKRRAVKVTAHDGWSIVDEAPVKFARSRTMLPLPEPEGGESIDLLRRFLNTASEDDFRLIVGWAVAAFRDEPPAAILAISGEQGSAKSTASRFITSLTDPRRGSVRGMICNARDLAIATKGAWVLAFDNISFIPADLSDHLCRLSTGDAFSTRKLHSDDEEVVFEACRPILLNGIGDPITRSDLADRTIPISLAAIPKNKRRSEQALMAEWKEKAPYIFAALLDGLSSALRHLDDIDLENLERLADMQQFVTAAEPGLGCETGTFNAAFERARQNKRLDSIAINPVARIIC
ncbi:MAG: toprim domain-containing protein [Pseudomonadota bacterium]